MRFWIDAVLDEFTRMTWQGWIVTWSEAAGSDGSYIYIAVRPTREGKPPLPGDGHHTVLIEQLDLLHPVARAQTDPLPAGGGALRRHVPRGRSGI
jgi:hypothetical protein